MLIWELEDVLDHHGYYRSTTDVENSRYLNALDHPEKFVWGVAHFDTANLKWQNDKGLRNKMVVNALENLYRKGLFTRIKEHPLLSRYLIEEFSDFKTCRFAFREVPLHLRERFDAALSEVSEQAALAQSKYGKSYLAFDPPTVRRIKQGGDANSELGRWHTSGWSFKELDEMTPREVADISALRSRLARENIDSTKKNVPMKSDNDGAVEHLVEFQSVYKEVSEKLHAKFGDEPKIFEAAGGQRKLSMRLVELIRKNPTEKDLKDAIRTTLQLDIRDPEILKSLLAAEKQAGVFSPTITNEKRIIPIPQGYTVSIDIKGVGAKNSQELMHSLSGVAVVKEGEKANTKTTLNAVRAARASEVESTKWVKKMKDHVTDAAAFGALTKTDDQVAFTGDDGMVNRQQPFQHKSVDIRRFFLQALISTSPAAANQFRIVMVAPEYHDAKTKIPEDEQFTVINAFEDTLKKVAGSYDPEHLSVSVSVDSNTEGGGRFRVYITGAKVAPAEVKRIERLIKKEAPQGYQLEGNPEIISYGIR